MAKDVTLKTMRCPTCGASLKVENPNEAVECLYCGNSIVPVMETSAAPADAPEGILRIDGIQTSASALAYLELLFEEFDWEDFSYGLELSIPELDELAESLRVSSADDKRTWLACAKICAVPYLKKATVCGELPQKIAKAYDEEDADAYGLFDAYKQTVHLLKSQQEATRQKLERYLELAKKYDASAQELGQISNYIDQLAQVSDLTAFETIEEIPQVKEQIEKKEKKLVEDLAAAGINAPQVYNQAISAMQQKQYFAALNLLRSVQGYKTADKLIKRINRYYLFGDVLQLNDRLYYYTEKNDVFRLHNVINGQIQEKPLITNIGKILNNYADILYYMTDENKLKRYEFSTGTSTALGKKLYTQKDIIYSKKWQAYFLMSEKELTMLDLVTGTLTVIFNKAKSILAVKEDYLSYTYYDKEQRRNALAIYNIATKQHITLGSAKSTIVAYKDGKAYCTCQTPDDKNLTFFTKELAPGGAETVLEKNIYKFEGIYADKLFFYVGSVHNRCLISMNLDGTGRTEWISGISSIFRYQGGWLYFMRRSGHNTVLCRSRLDGSEYRIITSDIDQLVSIQNGYLYYLTDYQALMRIRMNGSKKVLLRRDIEKVLAVREDQIVFTAQDQVRTLTDENGNTKRLPTLSIYSVDMRGSGIRKLVYDVQTTDLFNEDTVYYTAKTKVLITSEEGEEQSEKLYLYALNLLDRSTRTLMELKIPEAPTGCGCAAWGFLAIFFSILLFFGAMSELGFLTVIGLIGATVGVIAAIAKAAAKTE